MDQIALVRKLQALEIALVCSPTPAGTAVA
jgi:hypothetical protein